MRRPFHTRAPCYAALFVAVTGLALPTGLSSQSIPQSPGLAVPSPPAAAVPKARAAAITAPRDDATPSPFDAAVPTLRVTDARIEYAMRRLVEGSPTARGVLADLAVSGMVVAIGTPEELAALPDSQGGPAQSERRALLAEPGADDVPPAAWMVFRVAPPPDGAPAGASPTVERAWVAIDVVRIEGWIRAAGDRRAEALIDQDLLAILAHEFVAHVGSVARTTRLADFCDDPPPGARPGADVACSLRVENRVRRELNEGLRLKGAERLSHRATYALDIMNFEQARLKQTR